MRELRPGNRSRLHMHAEGAASQRRILGRSAPIADLGKRPGADGFADGTVALTAGGDDEGRAEERARGSAQVLAASQNVGRVVAISDCCETVAGLVVVGPGDLVRVVAGGEVG
ncbi:MAG: hypothetical protein QOJ37_2734 [Pseudonocardiales bacterium]|nr:hypothetical protein [Pseudonocardiales bacterium]